MQRDSAKQPDRGSRRGRRPTWRSPASKRPKVGGAGSWSTATTTRSAKLSTSTWTTRPTGPFGLRSTFVPLAEAREVGDELQVPHQRLQVKQAPNIEPDGQLSAAEEAELYRHYGLDHDSVTLDSGAPAGQALAEAADQTDEPERTDQAGATVTGVPEPASSATGGLADTGLDGEPGTSASGSGSLGLDREPDTSPVEAEQDRGGARAALSATGGGEPVEPAGH